MLSRWLWMKLNLSQENTQNDTKLSIMNAYVYPEYIAITITAQHLFKKQIYCRYYDCHRHEINNSHSKSEVFPESTVHCPRVIGAQFMSLSEQLTTNPTDIVPLTFRVYKRPVHQFSVCLSPIYGKEPKWLQIAEFIEDYKLQGASYFYIYIGDISSYDRQIIDDYARTGDIEIIQVRDKYERPFYSWQLIANNDCHQRSKYHSKWTAFVDLDERIQTFGSESVLDIINKLETPNVGVVQLMIQRIARTEDAPVRYENLQKLQSDMIFRKFTRGIEFSWNASKAIIRPDQVGIMSVHYAVALNPGVKTLKMTSDKMVLRHYRTLDKKNYGGNWNSENDTFFNSELDSSYAMKLSNKVEDRVRKVYEVVVLNCKSIREEVWKSRNMTDPCIVKPDTLNHEF